MYAPLVTWAREVRDDFREAGQEPNASDVAEVMIAQDHAQRHGFYLLNSGQMAAQDDANDIVTHVDLRIMVIRFVAVIVINERDEWVH